MHKKIIFLLSSYSVFNNPTRQKSLFKHNIGCVIDPKSKMLKYVFLKTFRPLFFSLNVSKKVKIKTIILYDKAQVKFYCVLDKVINEVQILNLKQEACQFSHN
jgi:hypothetical protein